MKKLAAKTLLLLAASFGAQTAVADFTTVFTDSCYPSSGCTLAASPGSPQYYGGDGVTPTSPSPGNDILGDPTNFDILNMTVSQAGTNLVVSVLTRFVQDTSSSNIIYGDLMLATGGWHPFTGTAGTCTTTAYYNCDTATTSNTHWNYVVQTTTGNMYHVTNTNLEKSNVAPNDGVFKADQYVLYGSGGTPDGTAGVSITNPIIHASPSDGYAPGTDLTYIIPLAALGVSPLTNTEVALRWAMTCANDIVEAAVNVNYVPEPATLSLFLGGLAGLRLLRRPQRAAKPVLPG